MNTYRTITYGNWVTQTDSFESVYDPVDTIITMPPEGSTKKSHNNKTELKILLNIAYTIYHEVSIV